MARTNNAVVGIKTANGAPAKHISNEDQLRRSVMSCLLWEKEFYESGENIATRIGKLVPLVDPEVVAKMAIEARTKMLLRHVPLLLIVHMLKSEKHRPYVADTIFKVVNRPDELGELVSLYYKINNFTSTTKHLASQLKKGLANAFTKFNEYQLAKWNRDSAIKLRDVLFMVHPKPTNVTQSILWKKLIGGYCKNCGSNHYNKKTKQRDLITETCSNFEELTLTTPDTWEVELSASTNKNASWTRLVTENKLGALALLRNLRNMDQASVDRTLVQKALATVDVTKVLPYRFIAAAQHAPQLEDHLEQAFFRCIAASKKLKGHTVLLMDVSGSMNWPMSDPASVNAAKRSNMPVMKRMDAACALAMLLRELCEDISIYSFSNNVVAVPPRHGFALRDAINNSQKHEATYLGATVRAVYAAKGTEIAIGRRNAYGSNDTRKTPGLGLNPDRLIVVTDEQSDDPVPDPKGRGYMINVASAKNGVGYHAWKHLDGFSASVVEWIQLFEGLNKD